MNALRLLLAAVIPLSAACAHLPWARHDVTPKPNPDSLYWHAVAILDPSNPGGSLDTAIANLDAYLASALPITHPSEAGALRRLAVDARQLAAVQVALLQERANTSQLEEKAERSERSEEEKPRDTDLVREVQRLRERLANANAELERIRKRLATPPPAKPPL